jgi:hypothetical protein
MLDLKGTISQIQSRFLGSLGGEVLSNIRGYVTGNATVGGNANEAN